MKRAVRVNPDLNRCSANAPLRVRLGEVFDLQMGKTPARDNKSLWSGTNKWIAISDMGHDVDIRDTKEKITDFAVATSGIKPIPANTLVMSFKLSIGKVGITRELMYSNEAIMALIVKDGFDVDIHFMYHQLKNKDWSCGANRAVMGQTLNKRSLMNHQVILPPLAVQRKIAAELDRICALKRTAEKTVEKLGVLVKARFVEMFGDVRRTIRIGEYFDTQAGGTPTSSNPAYYEGGLIPWLTSGEIGQGVIYGAQRCITQLGFDNSSAKWTPVDSVLVAMYGATAGKVGLLKVRATTNQAVCAIMPSKRAIPEYLYHAVAQKSEWMLSQATGGAQPNISQGVVRGMEIPMPDISLQREFAAFVAKVEKLEAAAKRAAERLDVLYRAKLQEYFA